MDKGIISKQILIMVGFAEALAAPESVWSLINNGFKVLVFSRRGRKPPICRNRNIECIEVCSPEKDVNRSLEDIKSIVIKHKPDLIMPLDDSGIWVCNRVSSEMHLDNVGPKDFHSDFALDKRLQMEIAMQSGLRIIPSRTILAMQDLSKLNEFPVLLKPAVARTEVSGHLISGRQYRCLSKSELFCVARMWNEAYPMLAQPIIQGVGEGIFGLSTGNGIKAWTAHRRVRMMNPLGSGSSACESIEISDQPINPIERMINSINWKGLFMIEMIRDNKNQMWFMEMNGRAWGSMALARRRGYEYPAWAALSAIDPHFEPVLPMAHDKIVCRHLGREIVHILMVLRGHRIFSLSSWSYVTKTIVDILKISRNHKLYNLERGKTLFFLKDSFLTVYDALIRLFGLR